MEYNVRLLRFFIFYFIFYFFFIGMGGESKDFAGELYDALARRRQISTTNGITKEELRMFWEDMTNRDIGSRLQIFFDM